MVSMRSLFLAAVAAVAVFPCSGQERSTIRIDLRKNNGPVAPEVFGQFIEHLGRSITGGIYDEHSPLSDDRGFRRDVLEKIRALRPGVLRFPGGTYTKVYHWRDGIGPIADRPRRKNLIWGGVEDNHFGTDEYVDYCRAAGCEPFIVVNMGTGTPEEAAQWVEYCNGTGDTYWAALRRANGHAEPYNVRYWGLGNEESAAEDAGHLQDPARFVQEGWQFAKLMKLTDPSIRLVLAGDILNEKWNRTILQGMGPVCDYLSIHYYAGTKAGEPWSVFQSIAVFDSLLGGLDSLLSAMPASVERFPPWYRFPPRQGPVGVCVDEWGIWEPGGQGPYGLENIFTWRHALAASSYLNMFIRRAASIRVATWSQAVNILGCILTDVRGSVVQSVYYPLRYYREFCTGQSVGVNVRQSPLISSCPVPALDAAACYDEGRGSVTLFVVNRDSLSSRRTRIEIPGEAVGSADITELTGQSFEAANSLARKDSSVVNIARRGRGRTEDLEFGPASLTIVVLKLSHH
jgi:alpha-L-arabinofuranosidase